MTINKEELQKELDEVKKLDVLADSEGGKLLVKALLTDIVNGIDSLTMSFSTATHIELISNIAKIKERLNIVRSLTRAKKNKEFLSDELRDLLEQEIAE